jgi:putative endonuclease
MIPVRAGRFYYVYVLQSEKTRRWYTGSTNDLRKRFKEHDDNKVTSTKNRGPFELIYPVRGRSPRGGRSCAFGEVASNGVYYEACQDQKDARSRKKYLKTGMGQRYLKTRLKRFLALTG